MPALGFGLQIGLRGDFIGVGGDDARAEGSSHTTGTAITIETSRRHLIVRGLPADMTDNQILGIFGPYGAEEAVVISTTSAVIKMQLYSQAKWLLENLQGNIPVGLPTPVFLQYGALRGAMARPAPPNPVEYGHRAVPCWFFERGRCKRGSRCGWLHAQAKGDRMSGMRND